MEIFYSDLVGILVAFVGWVTTLVAVTSIIVGLLVSAVVLIDLDARYGIMGNYWH